MNLICFEFGVMISIWFWYGFDTVLIRFWYDFDMILIWFQWVGFKKKKQKQQRDRFLVDVSRFFYGFGTILIWFWCDLGTILIRFWYDFDTVLVWFWSGFYMVPMSWLQKKETETAQEHVFGRVFNGFYGFGMILIWFWYDFDTISIRFWYDFDMVPVGWLQKKKQKQPRDRFLVDLSKVLWFWYDFDTILIRFWYDFDTVLIRFWYGFGMILIRFLYGSNELASKKETETAQEHVFGRVFNGFLWFWHDFDMVLIRFWYDFDTILIWFWYGSIELASKKRNDTVLIRFWYGFDTIWEYFGYMVPMGWLQITSLTHIKNHNWNHIKIITETISKS